MVSLLHFWKREKRTGKAYLSSFEYTDSGSLSRICATGGKRNSLTVSLASAVLFLKVIHPEKHSLVIEFHKSSNLFARLVTCHHLGARLMFPHLESPLTSGSVSLSAVWYIQLYRLGLTYTGLV